LNKPADTLKMRTARRVLAVLGWRIHADYPASEKYVLVVAPHTSNWDFPLGLLASGAMGLRAHWMGKHSLFRGPFGWLFKRMGGVPVNRGAAANLIGQMRDLFAGSERMILALAPDGTRSKADHWKSGFYQIALAAEVPIVMAYMDYPNKQIGLGGAFMPSGTASDDMQRISAFFSGRHGKHPALESTIQLRPG
jgi:1-acyl-sn-glycerol-3-phosphate acyltransferase